MSHLLRADQDLLLRWVLTTFDAPTPASTKSPPLAPPLSVERFREAGLWSGLTALTGARAERLAIELPEPWRDFIAEQRREVAARQARFADLLPRVLHALHDAGVAAIPVKGAVLATELWPDGSTRPMADLDLIITSDQRLHAAAALERAGMRQIDTSAWEDTFLGWGDGTVGRTDGESAAHNGKIELHPGWIERLHHYLVDDGGIVTSSTQPGTVLGAPCHRLSPAAFAAHVLGHLSAGVVRADVRALNVIDAVVALRALTDSDRAEFVALVARLDPRLVGPGAWLVHAHCPDALGSSVTAATLARLPRVRARLATTATSAVLRSPDARTDLRWRTIFTTNTGERAHMWRQIVIPPMADRRPGQTASPVHFQVDRMRRAIGVLGRRVRA